MSEPTWTTVHIGGSLPAGKIAELLEWGENHFYDRDGDWSPEEIVAAANENRRILLQGLVNYGNPDGLLDFCKENNLTFWLHFDAGYEWGPGIQIWRPGDDGIIECSASKDQDPMADLPDLRRTQAEGRSLQEIIDNLTRFEANKVPPIAIVECEKCGGLGKVGTGDALAPFDPCPDCSEEEEATNV